MSIKINNDATQPDKHEGRIRAAVVGHSLIHRRQYDFFNHIQYSPWLYNFTDVLQLYPKQWANQHREGGQEINGTSMFDWQFASPSTFDALAAFKPDVVYVQQEFGCAITHQVHAFVRKALPKAAFVVFVWENLETNTKPVYSIPNVRELIGDVDYVICGNSDARELVRPFMRAEGNSSGEVAENVNAKMTVFPQVGIDSDSLFCVKKDIDKAYDFIFVGRQACYDDQTEVLSRKGFKLFKELDMEDEIATLNPTTNLIEYAKPTALQKYEYDGRLIHFLGKQIDLAVTPNHKLWVRRRITGRETEFGFHLASEVLEDFIAGKFEFSRVGNWGGNQTLQFRFCPTGQL